MIKARLLTVSALLFIVACKDNNTPTQISAPTDPSKIISDGAHGGNKDFFFLPPMVPLPVGNPDFELGKFNNTLKPSLRVDICELRPELQNGVAVLPTAGTLCVSGAPLKTFAPGSVNLVNLPVKQTGWWTLFNLPPDGFYYVLWDTRQSNLNVNKYYRIKVFIDGATEPLGVADVDPMSSLLQWKYTLTGQVIQLVDDVMLPIAFRVEHGGGSALCGAASLCVSSTISNNSASGSQTVTVDAGSGSIAGATFPNGWLPANGPQNVVVTIAQVDIGTTDPVTGESTKPCHVGLKLQQFPGCFNFTTTPHLAAIDESGRQFATPVTVAVCYSLEGGTDPRRSFAEMYASGPNEPPHPLEDASDAGILSAATRSCTPTQVIGAAPSTALSRLASASWNRIKKGVGTIFGVRTAYGVDLGLGGIATAFSNVGPAISATIQPVGSTEITHTGPGNVQVYVRLIGSNHHDGQHQNSVGLPDLPVHFQLAEGSNGAIAVVGNEVGSATQLDLVTDTLPRDLESPVSGGGYAGVNWAVPGTPGVYHLTVDGAALGGPITFNLTVRSAATDLGFLAGLPGSVALAVNDAGHAVGYSYSSTAPFHSLAFLWTNGQMLSLGSLSAAGGEATGINNNDEVCGWDGGGGSVGNRAWIFRNGTMTALEAFPGSTSSFADGINSSSQIVGYSTLQGGHSRSWIWQNGAYTDLGLPTGTIGFAAMGINDAGAVIGYDESQSQPWIWQNGTFTSLPIPGSSGTPRAINASGVVVGDYYGSDQHQHAVRWQNGTMTELGHLPGDTDSEAEGINGNGDIVGLSYGYPNGSFVARAFLWRNGQMTEFTGLAPNFAEAIAINSSGLIVGQSGGSPAAHATSWQAPPSP